MPENSSSAASAAIARGLGIECDVQKSSDGKAMVFHDWGLDRLTAKTGPVAACNAKRLGEIFLRGSTECIPTLREFLGLVDGQVPVLIEVKSKREISPAPLCIAVRRVLETYRGAHAVMSFDPRVGHWFARNSPGTLRGLVMTEEHDRGLAGRARRHLWLWIARPHFLAYDVRDLPSRFAAEQRARGIPLLTWTVRSPELRDVAARFADAPIAEEAGVAKITA